MPDLSESEFNELLGVQGNVSTNDVSLTPLTDSELSQVSKTAQVAELGTPRIKEMLPGATPDLATKMGARPGIPFDTVSGVPFLDRMEMSLQPTDDEVFKLLEREYPGQVRKNSFGMPIVTMRDENGKQKDVLANPIGIDWDDTTGILASLPEMGGVIASLVATRGRTMAPGVWNAIKTLGLTAAGGELAGAIKDVAVRGLEGQPIQPKEVAARRTAMAGLDVVDLNG